MGEEAPLSSVSADVSKRRDLEAGPTYQICFTRRRRERRGRGGENACAIAQKNKLGKVICMTRWRQ